MRFDATDPAFIADPYPTYRRLRDESPVHHDPASGLWLITRFADVERATNDYHAFSSSHGNALVDSPARVGKTLGSMDPPRHDELRRVIQRGLGVSQIEALLPGVRAQTRARIDALSDRRACDFVADISRPVLFATVGRLLGLDDAAAERAITLTQGLFHHDDGPFGAVLPADTFQDIFAFLRGEVRARAAQRGDDVISSLLTAREAGAPLSEEEIVANASTVLMAGNASIGHFLPNLIHALWRHPDERRALLDNMGLINAAIEESVRWDTSTQCFARQVMAETRIGDTVVPANSRVALFYASANRDERVIEDPDRFAIGRRRVRHFGFGLGPHICAGAAASRAILRAMLEELLPTLGEFDLDLSTAKRAAHVMVRGFVNLPMHW
jgi:cytochrome P450